MNQVFGRLSINHKMRLFKSLVGVIMETWHILMFGVGWINSNLQTHSYLIITVRLSLHHK